MEHTSQGRSNDLGDTTSRADDTSVHRANMQRHALGNDGERTGQDSGAANALNGSADDEGDRVWRAAADQGTNFEQGESNKKDPFDLELDVQLAEHELEAAGREQVSRAIPGYVL